MRRLIPALFLSALLIASSAVPASAEFGLKDMDVTFTDADGSVSMQAGSHPFAMRTVFALNTRIAESGEVVEGAIRDLDLEQAVGFSGDPFAVPRCTTADFLAKTCSPNTALGYTTLTLGNEIGETHDLGPIPIYNLNPSPGTALKLGFWADQVPVTIDGGLSQTPPYRVIASSHNTSGLLEVFDADTTLWGNPADPTHDPLRGSCAATEAEDSCPTEIPPRPFITLPRSCKGPLITDFKASAWWTGDPTAPGPPAFFAGSAETHDDSIPPQPLGTTGCSRLGFFPHIAAQPTSENAESPTGLDFNLDITDEGLTSPEGNAQSDMGKAVVTLPEGMTINPSQAEGLKACSEEDLAREKPDSAFGIGCPPASKVGNVEVETPVLEGKILKGSLFVAEPYRNPTGSLIAIYMVIKDAELGVVLKLAGKVTPDPRTGQLITTFDDIPQQPVSHFRVHFREGGRSPLITPPRCGTYTTVAEFTPSANPDNPVIATSDFQINRGVGGGPCPPAGTPPFVPGFQAGSRNNNAASYSPFSMRLTRRDGDQDLTRFDATLPRGMIGKLAGVSRCPEAAIALAKAKSGIAELASPSCPANSHIGYAMAGAGVGPQLLFVRGEIYLAGPFAGAPLSVVAVTPAVAGPFDVGTVVVREALQINPRNAEVRADGGASDPIPHILAGIPLRVREIQVYVDRPQFTLNPTSCDPFAAAAQLWGGGSNPFSSADDSPVSRTARFQAANCQNLGFKPSLSLRLKGGNKRGGHPALHSLYRPRPGDANLSKLVLRLPRSAFLDQGHIRTICTRVQFAADACPPGAVYGHASALTPLLDEPLEGPVYLRSSSHNLPDLVLDLHGLVDFEAVGRIDSKNGGIRATFSELPDAPVSKVVVTMQGGDKGLVINSRNLCAKRSRASLDLTAQSNKRYSAKPEVKPTGCGGSPGRGKGA